MVFLIRMVIGVKFKVIENNSRASLQRSLNNIKDVVSVSLSTCVTFDDNVIYTAVVGVDEHGKKTVADEVLQQQAVEKTKKPRKSKTT